MGVFGAVTVERLKCWGGCCVVCSKLHKHVAQAAASQPFAGVLVSHVRDPAAPSPGELLLDLEACSPPGQGTGQRLGSALLRWANHSRLL